MVRAVRVAVCALCAIAVAVLLSAGPGRSSLVASVAALAGLLVAIAVELRQRARARRRRDAREAHQRAAGAERARLARDMHDSLSKTLDALALGAAALPTTLDEPGRARRLADTLREASEHAARDARNLIGGLRDAAPGLLDEASVRALCDRWSRETGVAVTVRVAPVEVAEETAYELSWILREALRNAAAHAAARHVEVELSGTADVTLAVRDDGRGFAVPVSLAPLQRAGHLGLVGMAERAGVRGGRLDVTSGPDGTSVVATVPASAPAPPPAGSRALAVIALAAVVALIATVVLATRPGSPDRTATGPTASAPTTGPGPAGSDGPPSGTNGSPPPGARSPSGADGAGGPSPSGAGGPAPSGAGRPSPSGAGGQSSSGAGATPPGGSTAPHPPTGPAAGDGSCRVRWTMRQQWNNGFIADVAVTNAGPEPLAPWTLRFVLTGDQNLTTAWPDVVATQNGRGLSFTGTDVNTTLAAGQTLVLSVQGSWTADDSAPVSFTLNGRRCG